MYFLQTYISVITVELGQKKAPVEPWKDQSANEKIFFVRLSWNKRTKI